MQPDLKGKLILVADDDVQFGTFVQTVLTDWGCRVLYVNDGREALLAIDQESPDLVLTDLSMPAADGIELILGIRRSRPDLPVVAMSGAFAPRTQAFLGVSKKLGADAVLTKPFTMLQLRETLDNLLHESGLQSTETHKP